METIRIVVVDDHKIVRQGVRALLETEPGFQVVGEAASGQAALDLITELDPQVLVTDLQMPGMNGIEVTRKALGLSKRVRVVVLSMYNNEAYVLEALRSGARGYVLKDCGLEELVSAVRGAADGIIYLSAPIAVGRVATLRDQLQSRLHSGTALHPPVTSDFSPS